MTQPTDPTGPTRPSAPAPQTDPTRPPEPIDDLVLAGLVRDVADGWHLPPRRLDEPTWSDRIDRRHVGRGTGWLGRLAGAAAVAIVATVILSLGAVWLGQPRGQQAGTGASPSAVAGASGSQGTATPRPTVRPSSTPLPELLARGDLPSVTSVLVRSGPGHAVVDLTTGKLGSQVSRATGGGTLVRRADGTLACLCVDADGYAQSAYTHVTILFRTYDAVGKPLASSVIGDHTGIPDPRPLSIQDQPAHVDTATSVSPDGRLGFVGWTAREPPLWHSGVIVVDMASGAVVARLALPDISTGADDAVVQGLAPGVAVSPGDTRILVTARAYRIVSSSQVYAEVATHGVAKLDGTSVGSLVPFAPTAACTEGESDSGIADDGRVWLSCWPPGRPQTVRRIGTDGSVLGDTQVVSSGEEGLSATASDGSVAWFWEPTTRTLTRVDLRTGQDTSASAPAPSASSSMDLLGAIGRWIAPSAGAKVFLDPGIVLSPDGTRIYALGIDSEASGAPFGGSSGVFVFDATTLAPLDHWAPVADYISIAISGDGRSVFVAGAPGVDAGGRPASFDASIVVYDAVDGSVVRLAGRLGSETLTFSGPLQP